MAAGGPGRGMNSQQVQQLGHLSMSLSLLEQGGRGGGRGTGRGSEREYTGMGAGGRGRGGLREGH